MNSIDYDSPRNERDIKLHDYLQILAVSCLFYDHALTIGQEIEYLWNKPKNRSAYWFFVNRYLAFWGNIAVTVLGFTTLSAPVLLIVNQVVVCILLTLRVYALYDCSIRIMAFLAGSGMVLAVVSLWTLFGQKSSPDQKASGCHIGFTRETSIRSATAWEALLIYDLMIFTLTILKTWKARRDHAITGINIPLISLILRDGAIYFAVMALCNFANILTYYFAGPFLRGGLSTFASSISVTMMSRLTLNLHRTAKLGILSTSQGYDVAAQVGDSWSGTLDIISPDSMAYDNEADVRPQSRSRRHSKPPPRQ